MSELFYACLYQPPDPGIYRVPADAGERFRQRLAAHHSYDRADERADQRSGRQSDDRAAGAAWIGEPRPAGLGMVAEAFSPRYERHGQDVVVIDVSGLDRLIGPPRVIGDELRRDAADRGLRVHVAIATTRVAAIILAHARPGVTVVDPGSEAAALAPLSLRVLEQVDDRHEGTHEEGTYEEGTYEEGTQSSQTAADPSPSPANPDRKHSAVSAASAFQRWGLRTLGELAALPAADLRARLGVEGLRWQAMARGEDVRPLVPDSPDERFTSSIELEWPIEGAEPLSFVLTRLLEPLSTRLERRDRGAAALHVHLRLVTKEVHVRRLQLPSPLREVRTLRTLALLDLESHPPAAAIDQVTVTIDPTPARVVQHTLFTRAVPTPDQLATLLARLGALIGTDRIGAPATIDSYRPGGFAMTPFTTDHEEERSRRRAGGATASSRLCSSSFDSTSSGATAAALTVVSALRRCRQPVPARVVVGADARPSRVTTDRRGFAGGSVVRCAGPWRTSGEWWESGTGSGEADRAGKACKAGGAGGTDTAGREDRPGRAGAAGAAGAAGTEGREDRAVRTGGRGRRGGAGGWNRDEWDVALSDGAVYCIFRDRVTEGWFIDAIVD